MDLVCGNAMFRNNKKNETEDSYQALLANNMSINGKVEFTGKYFRAEGGVNLDYTRIGSYLDCREATFISTTTNDVRYDYAFAGGKLSVSGSIYMNDSFKAMGKVMLNEAQVGRNLLFDDGEIQNEHDIAFWGNHMNIAGGIYMNNFYSLGEFCLDNTCVGGDVLCKNSEFKNASTAVIKNSQADADQTNNGPYALSAEGIKIGGKALFEHLTIIGAFSFMHAEIKMRLVWKKIREQPNFSLFLAGAKIGVLDDEPESWPEQGNLRLTDLTYNYVEDLQPQNLKKRYTKWLRLTRQFRPQPYEQLADVLRKCGYEDEATEVMIEKNRRSRKDLPLKWWGREVQGQSQSFVRWILKFIQGLLVGYGYKPGYAAKWGIYIIFWGWFVFFMAFTENLMAPLDSENGDKNLYQIARLVENDVASSLGLTWYSLVYSLDTFIPIIQFQTSSYWLPTAYPGKSNQLDKWGFLICIYRWIHVFLGWVISSMFVIALGRFSQR
jgi:hypothetical protein